jgi:hypothetical protein
MLKRIALVLVLVLLAGWIGISVIVELDGAYIHEELGGGSRGRALVLFHPSRDAHFSDDISMALVEGFKAAGLTVERATLTRETPAHPAGYAIIGVVSNTYYWTPDLPTLRYLERARLDGVQVIGVIGGAGSTGRSQRLLDEALRRTGATVLQTRSFWLWRPNDESRIDQPNRGVALQLAREFGLQSATTAMADVPVAP